MRSAGTDGASSSSGTSERSSVEHDNGDGYGAVYVVGDGLEAAVLAGVGTASPGEEGDAGGPGDDRDHSGDSREQSGDSREQSGDARDHSEQEQSDAEWAKGSGRGKLPPRLPGRSRSSSSYTELDTMMEQIIPKLGHFPRSDASVAFALNELDTLLSDEVRGIVVGI